MRNPDPHPEVPRGRRIAPLSSRPRHGIRWERVEPVPPGTPAYWTRPQTEWFRTRRAAERAMERWLDGRAGHASKFRPPGTWKAEFVTR